MERIEYELQQIEVMQRKAAKRKRNLSFGRFGEEYIINDLDKNECHTFQSLNAMISWVEEHI